MSEHKTGLSNWTDEDKKLYLDRRSKGLRGQLGYINMHQVSKDDKDNEQLVPLGHAKAFSDTVAIILSQRRMRREV